VARIDMNKDQLVGLSIATLKASREITPTAISKYLRDFAGAELRQQP